MLLYGLEHRAAPVAALARIVSDDRIRVVVALGQHLPLLAAIGTNSVAVEFHLSNIVMQN